MKLHGDILTKQECTVLYARSSVKSYEDCFCHSQYLFRCRCTERLVPGCTRRFCNIDFELSTKTPELIVSPVSESTGTRNNNKEAGVVNFPGANSGALTKEEKKACTDSDGNKR